MWSRKSLVGARRRADAYQVVGHWFASVLLAALLGGWLMSAHMPMALVLPAISILMVVSGFILAAILYLAGSRLGDGSSVAWEIAGALVFLGFAATLLTDSEQALALLDQIETRGLAALTR